ncbi:hypothetical protein TWF506_000449 [Arthrobotrys conoides]|uniref:Uncharacterized protein n=1 Tax=Arthrobotrys conoides TaxID=74498 RepID=A0AAN8NLG2_9PEZI
MLSALAKTGLLSISSLLFYGNILNNHATAFKISLEGREVEAGGYIENLTLCDPVGEINASFTPSIIFAVPSPATCAQQSGLDNWVLEELMAPTSAHTYFALRSTDGDYIIHAMLSPGQPTDRYFKMSSGAPGVKEDRQNYVKSEFWLKRNGKLQLIDERNPVQDGDLVVFAGPGPQESHTSFYLMRSPNARGRPAKDYKYQLFALLPGDDTSIASDAKVLVRGLRIRLTGEFGEIVVAPRQSDLIQQGPENSQPELRDPLQVQAIPNLQSNNLGQNLRDQDPGGLFYEETPDDLAWPRGPLEDKAPGLQLSNLMIQRKPGQGARAPGRGDAGAGELARSLGLPISRAGSNKTPRPQTDEQSQEQSGFAPNLRLSRSSPQPARGIKSPGFSAGVSNEKLPLSIIEERYYTEPPEVGLDGEKEYPPALPWFVRMEPFSSTSQQAPDFEPVWGSIPYDHAVEALYLNDYQDDDGDNLGSNGYSGSGGFNLAGALDQQPPLQLPVDTDIYQHEPIIINPAGSDTNGYQYYQPEEVYIDEVAENEDIVNLPDPAVPDIDIPESGPLDIPTSLLGQSSNSQGRNSPYPFGTSQSPPGGNSGLSQQPASESQLLPGQWEGELDPEDYFPDDSIPRGVGNVDYNGLPLEQIEEEGSGESSARIDDRPSSQTGMQYEENESNGSSPPGLLWSEALVGEGENEIDPGTGNFDDKVLKRRNEAELENPTGSLEKRAQSEDADSDDSFSQGIPQGGQPQRVREDVIPRENLGPNSDDQEELEVLSDDEAWDSSNRVYDPDIYMDWDETRGDGISWSNGPRAVEMKNLLMPPTFDVKIPQDYLKRPSWWDWTKSKLMPSKSKEVEKVREATGFE